jgi:3-oxoacyl-[acyl-carrier protein] reductase
MYMGRVISSPEGEVLRQLTGARVLITGLNATCGVDVARAFAGLKTRLIVHTSDLSPDMTELFALLTQSAAEIRLFTTDLTRGDSATEFARTSAQAYGGLDAVINFARITSDDLQRIASDSDVDELMVARLSPVAHLTRVIANRMRLVFSEGMILNVLKMPKPHGRRDVAIATVARTMLATMTKREAQEWSGQGVRINAIGPEVGGQLLNQHRAEARQMTRVANDPDIAALALFLASSRGRDFSGVMFDAEPQAA